MIIVIRSKLETYYIFSNLGLNSLFPYCINNCVSYWL